MQIQEIMTRNPEVVTPDTSLQAAAQKMESLDVGSMPVCDGKRLVGMITDRDITIRATAGGMDPNEMKVSEIMTDHIHYCYADQSVEEAARIMKENQIRRLPVIGSENQQLVGIVALGDLAVDSGDTQKSAETLEEISRPSHPNR
jgi:CBS domain-containing protein